MTAEILDIAQRALADRRGDVRLTVRRRFTSPHTLLRCEVEGGLGTAATVIVKRITTTDFTTATGGVSGRLRNERAVLERLSAAGVADPPWPRLLGAAGDVLVLEDLGDHPTALDVLHGDDAAAARRCLAAMGTALAALHEAGRAVDHPGGAPRSDSTYDLRDAREALDAVARDVGLPPPPHDEIADLEAAIHGPGQHRTLIHADAGPQNFLWDGGRARLVDFEFATPGHAMLDVVSARLGFPHSMQARTVPAPYVAALEAAYGASDPAALTDACAHWALVRLGALHDRLPAAPTMRAQAFTLYRRFVATAAATGHRLPIADAVDRYTLALQRRYPGLDETSPFPAL